MVVVVLKESSEALSEDTLWAASSNGGWPINGSPEVFEVIKILPFQVHSVKCQASAFNLAQYDILTTPKVLNLITTNAARPIMAIILLSCTL